MNLHQNYFIIKRSRIQGRGAFAIRTIRKGTKIVEYVGRRIHPDEETKYYDEDSMERHHTFLFGVDRKTTIDAAQGGNESRYINHSCTPNCEAINHDGRIFIHAARTIYPGEELTYDYHFEVEGRITRKTRDFYACNCGTSECRVTILVIPKKKKNDSSRKT